MRRLAHGVSGQRGRLSYAVVYLGGGCGDGLGAGLFPAVAIAHELTHSLNALAQVPAGQPGPPNVCPGDPGHPCDISSDLIYPSSGAGVALAGKVLDAGRDDYYGHVGAWWDVRDSLFLEHLDSPDRAPPGPPAGITARSGGPGGVEVVWQAATDDVGPVSYEVYRDGALAIVTPALNYVETIVDGESHTYLVRPRDGVGRVGPSVGLRYTGGLGIVDAAGVLLVDTVAPSPVTRIRVRLTKGALVLTWSASVDAGGVAGYRVYRDGRLQATVRTTTLSVWRPNAAGAWSVRPFDRAGNRGGLSPEVAITVPRRP